jgi:hypothetical protein
MRNFRFGKISSFLFPSFLFSPSVSSFLFPLPSLFPPHTQHVQQSLHEQQHTALDNRIQQGIFPQSKLTPIRAPFLILTKSSIKIQSITATSYSVYSA